MESKVEIRRRLLSVRESIPEEERTVKSRLIETRFFANLLTGVIRIALYSPIRGEVETSGLFFQLRERGKHLFYPFVCGEEIGFSEVENLAEMKKGRFGIPEPQKIIPIPLQELAMAVVPGVAFDESGFRIGFGKGYYDRVLYRFSGVVVGLAYDFQIVKEIPRREDDLCCDYVVTEDRVIQRR